MIIDTEVHILQPEARSEDFIRYADEPVIKNIHSHPDFPLLKDKMSVEALKKSMGENNIDRAIIMGMSWLDPVLQEQNNSFVEKVVRENNHEFRAMFIPNLKSIGAAADSVKNINPDIFIGAKLIPGWQGVRIDDSRLAPLLEAIQAKDMFLMAHVDHPTQSLDGDVPYRLLEVLKKYPKLKVLAPHLGGLLCLYGLNEKIKPLLTNTYFISSVSSTIKFVKFAAEVNCDNILFGTDFPFNHCHDQKTVLEGISALNLSQRVEKKILGENAEELFDCDEW